MKTQFEEQIKYLKVNLDYPPIDNHDEYLGNHHTIISCDRYQSKENHWNNSGIRMFERWTWESHSDLRIHEGNNDWNQT